MKKDYQRWQWPREKVPDGLLANARQLRRESTEAEKILWNFLRNRNLNGFKFRRQQPLQKYILDFYCEDGRLGVEVDGPIHRKTEQVKYDEERTAYLNNFGIEVIRFSNEEVINQTEKVLDRITEKLKERLTPSPRPSDTPLPWERGRGEGKFFRFNALLQSIGWLSPAYVGVDQSGYIFYLSAEPPQIPVAIEAVNGIVLPGFQNTHSHAFQYAMAGLAENHPVGTDDDFWTWREEMYKCALLVNPEQAQAVAAMLYAEMVRHGYTHVAEFHYLHHDNDGKPYSNLAEMGERMVEAASSAGIKITLIPVFYQKGGFGKNPQPRQKRFISETVDDYFHLLDDSAAAIKDFQHASLGFSVHSLRAVNLDDIIKTCQQGPPSIPFHLHVAEQKKEVEDCLAFCKKRPMQWVFDNLPVNERFNFVHSTHLDNDELKRLASSKANVVLCPSTEGNLGDGIFRMKEYVNMGGHWCIGTDSHIGLNPFEELRMIDYRQRLITNKRNTVGGNAAHYFISESVMRGRLAMGCNTSEHFEAGKPFDALVINAGSHLFADTSLDNLLPSILYTSDSSRNLGTIVNGKWVVKNQHHQNGHAIKTAFSKAMKELKNR